MDLEEPRFDPVRRSFDRVESRLEPVRPSFDLVELRLDPVRLVARDPVRTPELTPRDLPLK